MEAPLLMVVEVPAAVEEEGGRPCSLVEVLLGGPQRAQQGGLGKENLSWMTVAPAPCAPASAAAAPSSALLSELPSHLKSVHSGLGAGQLDLHPER